MIRSSIVRTLAFFDIFHHPLTSWETWKFLRTDRKVRFEDVVSELSRMTRENGLIHENGLFGLSRCGALRKQRYLIAEKKFKKALFFGKILSFIPTIRCICVCNSLAYSNADENSDIDFFIMTEARAIWTTRLCAAGMMEILGQRPQEHEKKDKVCLSFYVSEDDQNIERFRLSPSDPYFSFWLATLVPIYQRDGAYREFISNNAWIFSEFANWFCHEISPRRTIDPRYRGGKTFGKFFESVAKRFQMRMFPEVLRKKHSGIHISDTVLRLYATEKRKEYREAYEKRLIARNVL